jgi:hypothetical protein
MVAVSFPILYVYAQGQAGSTTTDAPAGTTDTATSVANIINSVALIIGVIVPLIVSGAAYVKSKSQDPRIKDAADTAISVGRIATATANKALENKKHIKEVLEVGLALAPEQAKRVLAENKEKIDQLNKEILATEAQIKRLVPYIPNQMVDRLGPANADSIQDLPREPLVASPPARETSS